MPAIGRGRVVLSPLLLMVACSHLKHGVVFWEEGCPDGARYQIADDGRNMGRREYCEIPRTRTAGVLHGRWLRTWPDGTVRRQGQYDHGRQTGTWRSFYHDGKPMQTTQWRADEPSGEQQRWHRNGKTMWRGWLKTGRRQGHWAGFFPDGSKAWIGQFKEGRPYGDWVFYRRDGGTDLKQDFGELLPVRWWQRKQPCPDQSTPFGAAPPAGLKIECREQPKERLTPERHGPTVEFFGDGTPRTTGAFQHGQKNGRWITWRENGSPRVLETWWDGELSGPRMEFDRDGVLTTVTTFQDGQPGKTWTRAWCPQGGREETGDWWTCEETPESAPTP